MNASYLLAAYRDAGSEQAFADLIHHYANLVFSVAKRRLGESTLAEDVTQIVFTRLAKSPPRVGSDAELVAWLHRTTVHAAIDCWRSETRRRNREQHAVVMQPTSNEDARVWEDLSPHLDKALDKLSDADRQAVLLRFFERQPMREIGRALGVSEDAAKMRVSRALDRLREQLGYFGVTCTAVSLTTLLLQCSVEAAPAHLFARLGAIQRSVRAAAEAGVISSLMPSLVKAPAFLRVAVLLGVAVVAFIFLRNTRKEEIEMTSVAQSDAGQTKTASEPSSRTLFRRASGVRSATAPEVQPEAKFVLQVVERGTGAGLAGARVKAAYFYAGGVGERHEMETDATGHAAIPQPNSSDRETGLNLFVCIEGYVPQCVGFGRRAPEKNMYLLELDTAQVVGGAVIDQSGQPVPGVAMEAHRQEAYKNGGPNTDFQTTKVTTDSDGRWIYPYVPRNYETVSFNMTCSNYAVTRASVPTGKAESLNAVLVIQRGFAVAGRVTDSTGQAVAGAIVKELHNFGQRRLSTQTDADGGFALLGVADPNGEPMELVVQAKGLAPQRLAVPLIESTNIVNFVLPPGSVFRGRVVDDAGNPIANASVRTDFDFKNQIPTRFEWLTHTDAEGRFEWGSAPAEITCFWFQADGYDVIRSRPMLPDGTDHQIKLVRKTNRTGIDQDN